MIARRKLSKRDRRALEIGGAVILLLVAGTRGLPWVAMWSTSVQVSSQLMVARATRAEAVVREIPAIRAHLKARSTELLALAPRLLGGRSAASASGTLAGLISGAATTAGLSVGAVNITVDSASSHGFFSVRARVQLTGDVAGLAHLLRSLEGGPVLLRVREMTISQQDPGAGADRPESLQVELIVEGLMWRRETGEIG